MGGSPPAAVAIFTRQQPQSQSILILGRRRKRGCRSLLEPDSRPQVEGHGQRQGACVCCLTAAAGPAKVLVFTVAVWFIVMASGCCCVCGGGSHGVSRVMSLWSYVLPCWSTARCHPGGSIPSCIAGFPLGTFWELSSEHDTQRLRRCGPLQYEPGSAASQDMQGSALLGLCGLVCVRRKTQKQFVPSPFLFNCFTFSSTRLYLSRSRPLSSSAPPLLRTAYLISAFFTFEHFEFFDGSGIVSFDHWCVCACAGVIEGTLNICKASYFGSLTAWILRV